MVSNPAIVSFVRSFGARFSEVIKSPDERTVRGDRFPHSDLFVYWHKPPSGQLSDWDLGCWLKTTMLSPERMKELDQFVRNYDRFTEVGLFSRPNLEIEDGMQYMAYTPGELYAPFLDLHIRGKIGVQLWSAVYDGNSDDHQKWAMLTAWRKLKKGDSSGARRTYQDELERYWPDESDVFLANPRGFVMERLPGVAVPSELI